MKGAAATGGAVGAIDVPASTDRSPDGRLDGGRRRPNPRATWRTALTLLVGVTVLALAAVIIVPVVMLVILSFKKTTKLTQPGATMHNYVTLFDTNGELTILDNTVVFIVAASALAVVLGALLAWAVTSVNMPGRRFLRLVPIMALILPPLVKDPAWIILFGPQSGLANIAIAHLFGVHSLVNIYSLPGMIAVGGFFAAPVVYIVMLAPFEGIDKSLVEASTVSGASVSRTVFRTTLPMVRPALLSGTVLVVMIIASAFETPVLVGEPGGVHTYMEQIYDLVNSVVPSLNVAAAQGAIYLVLTTGVIYLYLRATANERRFAAIAGKGHEHTVIEIKSLRWVLFAIFVFYGLLVFIAPLVLIILISFVPYYSTVNGNPFHSFTLTNYRHVFADAQLRSSIITSTTLAACVAVAAAFMALMLAWISLKTRVRARFLADFLAMSPIAIPPMVLSLGLLLTVLSVPGVTPVLYGTHYLMFLADLIVFLPVAMRLVSSTLVQVQDELIEAARMSGASQWGAMRSVIVPIVRPALLYTGAVVFILSYRELAAIVLIPAQNTPLVPYAGFAAWLSGGIVELAALNVLTILVPLVVVGIVFALANVGRIRVHRATPRQMPRAPLAEAVGP